jgi:hypothetical protein
VCQSAAPSEEALTEAAMSGTGRHLASSQWCSPCSEHRLDGCCGHGYRVLASSLDDTDEGTLNLAPTIAPRTRNGLASSD